MGDWGFSICVLLVWISFLISVICDELKKIRKELEKDK